MLEAYRMSWKVREYNGTYYGMSLPALGTNWADWLDALEREMYLCRALARLDLELLCELDI